MANGSRSFHPSSCPEMSSLSVSCPVHLSSTSIYAQLTTPVRTKPDSGIPCDLLLLRGTAIVNEAMLSGESTPLLKESIELREGEDRLDMNGTDRNSILFSGTKALQVEQTGEGGLQSEFQLLAVLPCVAATDLHSARCWLPRRRPAHRLRHHPGPARPHHDLFHRDHVGKQL